MEIVVFGGAGSTAEPLGLTALEAVAPAAIDAAALSSALVELAACVAGERKATTADLEATIRRVLPAFRHAPAEARLDDRI
jgi:hypothetical protein